MDVNCPPSVWNSIRIIQRRWKTGKLTRLFGCSLWKKWITRVCPEWHCGNSKKVPLVKRKSKSSQTFASPAVLSSITTFLASDLVFSYPFHTLIIRVILCATPLPAVLQIAFSMKTQSHLQIVSIRRFPHYSRRWNSFQQHSFHRFQSFPHFVNNLGITLKTPRQILFRIRRISFTFHRIAFILPKRLEKTARIFKLLENVMKTWQKRSTQHHSITRS